MICIKLVNKKYKQECKKYRQLANLSINRELKVYLLLGKVKLGKGLDLCRVILWVRRTVNKQLIKII